MDIKNKKNILKVAGLIVTIVIIFLCSKICSGCQTGEEPFSEPTIAIESEEDSVETKGKKEDSVEQINQIVVYLCGAIKNPGVYKLTSGARVYEAVNMAGGITELADPAGINMSSRLSDEMMIYIPKMGEVCDEAIISTGEAADSGLVNINTATKTQLESLSGIGPKLADAIISYRQENGMFTTKEDIKKVSGIGESTYAKLQDNITV